MPVIVDPSSGPPIVIGWPVRESYVDAYVRLTGPKESTAPPSIIPRIIGAGTGQQDSRPVAPESFRLITRTEWNRDVTGDRARVIGGTYVSRTGVARSEGRSLARDLVTSPLFGLVSVLPDKSEVLGNPFSDWTDTAVDAGRSEPVRKTGESHSWCRLCGMVEGDASPVTRKQRLAREACEHVLTSMVHDLPGADTGRTAMTVPSYGGPSIVAPLTWERSCVFGPVNPAGSAYSRRVEAEPTWRSVRSRDHGRRVTVLRSATPGPQRFGTGQHPDMGATSIARQIIGTGRWSPRTGESARHATPDRGAIYIGHRAPSYGRSCPSPWAIDWEPVARLKSGALPSVPVRVARHRAAVAEVLSESKAKAAPVSARAMRRRVADQTRAMALAINVSTGAE